MATKDKSTKGFTLIEVVISLGLLVMVFGGVTSLAILTSEASRSSKNNLIAAYLAKEAQEIIRYKRNLNYILDASPFDEIATEVDNEELYFTVSYQGVVNTTVNPDVREAAPLEIVSNFYTQGSGVDTVFRRLITTMYHEASDSLPAYIDVKVEVFWKEDTKQDTYILNGELVDWS